MSGWRAAIRKAPDPPLFIGADLEPFPFISGFGLLWRMTRLALLMPVELSALEIRNRKSIDVLQVLGRPSSHRNGLLRALQLESTRVAAYWDPSIWNPLRFIERSAQVGVPLRRCAVCSRYGYHCMLFQSPSISRCPWHDEELSENCNDCGTVCRGAFDDECRLGRCLCGVDPLDIRMATTEMWSFPTDVADAWICDYLQWAEGQRRRRWLVVPTGVDWRAGMATLAPLPANDNPAIAHSVSESDASQPEAQVAELVGEGEDPPARSFWGWCLLSGTRPLTYAPLPGSLHSKLCDATRSAVADLPEGCPTPFDLVISNGLEERLSVEDNVNRKPNCFFAPHGLTAGSETWLNLSAVDMRSVVFCGQLVSVALIATDAAVEALHCSPQAAESRAIDELEGRRHLAGALEMVLIQGYRQGLGMVVRRLLGGRFKGAPPERLTPVAEIVAGASRIESIRLTWVPCESLAERDSHRGNQSPKMQARRGSRARGRSRSRSAVRK